MYDLIGGDVCEVCRVNGFAVAQDRHLVGDLVEFREPVSNVENGDARRAQLLYQSKDFDGFRLGK